MSIVSKEKKNSYIHFHILRLLEIDILILFSTERAPFNLHLANLFASEYFIFCIIHDASRVKSVLLCQPRRSCSSAMVSPNTPALRPLYCALEFAGQKNCGRNATKYSRTMSGRNYVRNVMDERGNHHKLLSVCQ